MKQLMVEEGGVESRTNLRPKVRGVEGVAVLRLDGIPKDPSVDGRKRGHKHRLRAPKVQSGVEVAPSADNNDDMNSDPWGHDEDSMIHNTHKSASYQAWPLMYLTMVVVVVVEVGAVVVMLICHPDIHA
mmetsp:Transcript_26055/g.47645  ORF Transcript_26055/g.47645 Transcript_26055/m.47645 type:complete len:129 (+) Transcript_26055:462-848(+)